MEWRRVENASQVWSTRLCAVDENDLVSSVFRFKRTSKKFFGRRFRQTASLLNAVFLHLNRMVPEDVLRLRGIFWEKFMTGKSISTTPPDGVIEAISASHILHPHLHFTSPNEVLAADISAQEKRAILASWASDLYAVESVPALRQPPGVPSPVRYADILAALKALDDEGATADHLRQGTATLASLGDVQGPSRLKFR
ncbi:hypothetical protein [Rhizobium leguminosarum]|uniref:hypothetical protein n=1 Tax=Rhizobium leguminosarum TaxID=384 RepID=UPI001FEEF870|nr:hypothetical protein [Rhizobium leguminosarum]